MTVKKKAVCLEEFAVIFNRREDVKIFFFFSKIERNFMKNLYTVDYYFDPTGKNNFTSEQGYFGIGILENEWFEGIIQKKDSEEIHFCCGIFQLESIIRFYIFSSEEIKDILLFKMPNGYCGVEEESVKINIQNVFTLADINEQDIENYLKKISEVKESMPLEKQKKYQQIKERFENNWRNDSISQNTHRRVIKR